MGTVLFGRRRRVASTRRATRVSDGRHDSSTTFFSGDRASTPGRGRLRRKNAPQVFSPPGRQEWLPAWQERGIRLVAGDGVPRIEVDRVDIHALARRGKLPPLLFSPPSWRRRTVLVGAGAGSRRCTVMRVEGSVGSSEDPSSSKLALIREHRPSPRPRRLHAAAERAARGARGGLPLRGDGRVFG